MKLSNLCACTLLVSSPLFAFELSSPDIANNAKIDNKFVYNKNGCPGKNISPTLVWKDALEGTKSFGLMVYDPDARAGKGWWHWTVIDIPATETSLPQGFGEVDVPQPKDNITQIQTSFDKVGYGGPCPPVGDKPHHYIFTIYALKVEAVHVKRMDSMLTIKNIFEQNSIGQAKLTGLYNR